MAEKIRFNNVQLTRSVGTANTEYFNPIPPNPEELKRLIRNPGYNDNVYPTKFGYAVAANDSYIAIGSYYAHDIYGDYNGVVSVYDTSGNLVHTINNPNTSETDNHNWDWFGYAMAIDGNNLLVGAPQGSTVDTNLGKAYLFDLVTGNLVRTINQPENGGQAGYAEFGKTVALDGNIAAIASPRYWESTASATAISGRVYTYDITTGNQLQTFANPNQFSTPSGDTFGFSVALKNDVLVVGAPYENSPTAADSGTVYVFTASTGTLLGHVITPVIKPNAYFGYSVATNGTKFAVGEPEGNNGGDTAAGAVTIFDVATLTQEYRVYGATGFHYLGHSLAMSGNTIFAGARDNDRPYSACKIDASTGTVTQTYVSNVGTYLEGAKVAFNSTQVIVGFGDSNSVDYPVEVFDISTGVSQTTIQPLVPPGHPNSYDYFGGDISVSGDYLAIGSPGEYEYQSSNDTYYKSGVVHMYSVSTGTKLYTIISPDGAQTSTGDEFGRSVAIDGNYLIVGEPSADNPVTSSGQVHIYNKTDGTHITTVTNPNAYSTANNDNFGRRIKAHNGKMLVIAYGEDDATGPNAGCAYLFDIATQSLLATIENPNDYSTSSYDFFGGANNYENTFMSMNDTYIVIGAPLEDSSTSLDDGAVYVFDHSGNLLYTLRSPGQSASDYFGFAVNVTSTNKIIVGEYQGETTVSNSGLVHVFDAVSGNLLRTLESPNATNGFRFGTTVESNGDTVFISEMFYTENSIRLGRVYMMDANTGSLLHEIEKPIWTENTDVHIEKDAWFGQTLHTDGKHLIVGAPSERDQAINAGAVYIYQYAL